MISSLTLRNGIHPPEREINLPQMVCGCPCGKWEVMGCEMVCMCVGVHVHVCGCSEEEEG